MINYQNSKEAEKPIRRRTHFTPEEDRRLVELYNKYGPHWKKISDEFGIKNPKQCRERYNLVIAPIKNNEPYTTDEIVRFLKLIQIFGHKWRTISNAFNRTEVQLKNLYRSLKHGSLSERKIAEIVSRLPNIDNQIIQNHTRPDGTLDLTSNNLLAYIEKPNANDENATSDQIEETPSVSEKEITPIEFHPPNESSNVMQIIPGNIKSGAGLFI